MDQAITPFINDPLQYASHDNLNLWGVDMEKIRLYIRIVQSLVCPICKEVATRRSIICQNGHMICRACTGNQSMNPICCVCRQPTLDPPIISRQLDDVVYDVLDAIDTSIIFKTDDAVDIQVQRSDKTVWMEGKIIMVDYDSMSFLIRAGRFVMSRPFFSRHLALIHTHTSPWRNMETLSVGRRVEFYHDSIWIPAVIVYQDLVFSLVYVAYRLPDLPVRVEPVSIDAKDRIALFPTNLDNSPIDWEGI